MKKYLILILIFFCFPSICFAEFKVDEEAIAYILGFIVLFILFLGTLLFYSFRIPEQPTKRHFFYLLFLIIFYNYTDHVNGYYSIFSGAIKDIMEGYFTIIFAILLYKRIKLKQINNYEQLLFIGILLVQIMDILIPYIYISISKLYNHNLQTILAILINCILGYYYSKTISFNQYFNKANLISIFKIFIIIYYIPLFSYYFYIIIYSILNVEDVELFTYISSYFFRLDTVKSIATNLGMILIRYITFNIGVYYAFNKLKINNFK